MKKAIILIFGIVAFLSFSKPAHTFEGDLYFMESKLHTYLADTSSANLAALESAHEQLMSWGDLEQQARTVWGNNWHTLCRIWCLIGWAMCQDNMHRPFECGDRYKDCMGVRLCNY